MCKDKDLLAGEVFSDPIEYDENINIIIPGYYKILEKLSSMVKPDVSKILELGCGSGALTKRLLIRCPSANIKCIDHSKNMLSALIQKIPMEQRERVMPVHADFGTYTLDEKYDVCISSFAIHHLSDEGKERLFKRVFQALRTSGGFWIADAVLAESKYFDILYSEARKSHVKKGISRCTSTWNMEPEVAGAHGHKSTVENQMKMLRASGFSEVATVWKHFDLAIIGGIR